MVLYRKQCTELLLFALAIVIDDPGKCRPKDVTKIDY